MKLPGSTVLVNRTRLRSLALLAALVCLTPTARAVQGFNVDFGLAFGTPGATYPGAASQTGPWNKVGIGTSLLFKATGGLGSTSLTVVADVGTGSVGPAPVTSQQLLMNDHFYSRAGGTWSTTFTGLTDGSYLVALYAPADRAVPTGNMMVGALPVAGITGAPSGQLYGVTWTATLVNVSGGSLAISGSSPTISGLSGLQIFPASSGTVGYCTPGTTASGCMAFLKTFGTPSLSAAGGSVFVVTATGVEGNKDGVFFQGTNGPQANSWGSGTSFQCVVPPVQRLGLVSGNGTIGLCDGNLNQEFNQIWATQPAKNPGLGTLVYVQLWFRDPLNTSNQTTSLSSALQILPNP